MKVKVNTSENDEAGTDEEVIAFAEEKYRALEHEVRSGICTWHEDDDGHWHTDCKQIFTLFDGTPVENGFKFCPYCGKALVEEKFEYGGEDV